MIERCCAAALAVRQQQQPRLRFLLMATQCVKVGALLNTRTEVEVYSYWNKLEFA